VVRLLLVRLLLAWLLLVRLQALLTRSELTFRSY